MANTYMQKIKVEKYFIICFAVVLSVVALSACGKSRVEEAEEKMFGINFVQGQAVSSPEQIVCGQECAWAITAAKDGYIYQLGYASDAAGLVEIPWQQGAGESLVNIAQRDGVLYAQIYIEEEDIFEIRKYMGGIWLGVTAFEAQDAEWKNVGGGLHVDSAENSYLVSHGKVTCFGEEDQPGKEYLLGGDVRFFREDKEGNVECVAVSEKGIALYKLGDGEAEKKWELEISALQLSNILSSDQEVLCLATDEELLFVAADSGNLLARSSLLTCGVSSVLAGVYDAQDESLRLYGTESGSRNLSCSLLSIRDAAAEQRIELVYGTMSYGGVPRGVQAAITEFNKSNDNYYITVKNYNQSGDFDPQRLHMDMAGGNAPDIIEMSYLEYYESYVKNGYLENLSPYLEQSSHRDDIIWNVLNIYEMEGGLYLMMPHFSIEALAVNPEYEKLAAEWNMPAFRRLIEENRWERFIIGRNEDPEIILWFMLNGRQEEFIDWERKEASFETEAFLELLALCKENGEQEWPDTSHWTIEEVRENSICSVVFLPAFEFYLGYTDVYGREYPIYGYPTSSGQTYRIGPGGDSCAIYAGSKHKEGAWEYLESLLSDSYLLSSTPDNHQIPICSSALEEYGEEQKKESIGSQGNLISLTDAELNIMKDIIYHGNLVHTQVDQDILNVVQEEAAAYFAGDKSAEEVAHIIQSKVELILNE